MASSPRRLLRLLAAWAADRAVRDERPVASVELAAWGMEREACLSVVKAMEASGVRWAW